MDCLTDVVRRVNLESRTGVICMCAISSDMMTIEKPLKVFNINDLNIPMILDNIMPPRPALDCSYTAGSHSIHQVGSPCWCSAWAAPSCSRHAKTLWRHRPSVVQAIKLGSGLVILQISSFWIRSNRETPSYALHCPLGALELYYEARSDRRRCPTLGNSVQQRTSFG